METQAKRDAKLGKIDRKNPPAAGAVFVLDVPPGKENPTGETTGHLAGDGSLPDRFELEFVELDEDGTVVHIDRRDGQKFLGHPHVAACETRSRSRTGRRPGPAASTRSGSLARRARNAGDLP